MRLAAGEVKNLLGDFQTNKFRASPLRRCGQIECPNDGHDVLTTRAAIADHVSPRNEAQEGDMTYLAELLDRNETCCFFGGSRPINPATLYRGIRQGRYPRPVHTSPGGSRWLRSEC